MDSKQHVFDFLAKPVGQTPVGVCVLHGSERFLKTLAMKHLTGADAEDSAELSVTKFDATNSKWADIYDCLLYTSPSPRDQRGSRMPSSA